MVLPHRITVVDLADADKDAEIVRLDNAALLSQQDDDVYFSSCGPTQSTICKLHLNVNQQLTATKSLDTSQCHALQQAEEALRLLELSLDHQSFTEC